MNPRIAYLDATLSRHAAVSLPMEAAPRGAPGRVALDEVYQPLGLRSGTSPLRAGTEGSANADINESSDDDITFYYNDTDDLYLDDKKTRLKVLGGEQALARSPHAKMVILGGPGTGKTTLLRALFSRAARAARQDPDAPLPLFVELPALALYINQKITPQPTFRSYLDILAEELGLGGAVAGLLQEALDRGSVLVCLDGLDEVPPARRSLLLAWLVSLKLAAGAWVVGSRYTQYRSGDLGRGVFAEWELLPLDDAGQKHLAANLLTTLAKQQAAAPHQPDAFLHALRQHPQAATWLSTPLLFSLTAACWATSGGLPSSRAALYQRAVDALMQSRIAGAAERQGLLALFAQVALELFRSGGREFSEAQLRQSVDALPAPVRAGLPDSVGLVHELIGSGLLTPSGERAFRFSHHTLHEYLVGRALATALLSDAAPAAAAWELSWSKKTFSRWSEPLRLMVGVLVHELGAPGQARALVWLNALVAQSTSEQGDPGNLILALVIQSLGEIGSPPASWPEQELASIETLLDRWVEQSLQRQDDRRDARASLSLLARELARVDFRVMQRVTERLSQVLLGDEDARRRAAAARALGWLEQKAPAAVLARALADSSPDVRRGAAAALVKVAADCPTEPLLAALRDPSEYVRDAVADVLGAMGTRAPVAALTELARSSGAAYQADAVEALAGLGNLVPLQLFVDLSTEDADWKIRDRSIRTLGKRAEETVRSAPAVAAILHQFNEGDRIGMVSSACAAIRSLGDGLDPAVWVPSALKRLRSEDSAAREAAELLAWLRERAPMPELIKKLKAAKKSERDAAAHALVRLGAWVPVEPLAELLALDKRGSTPIKEAALRILGRTGERAPIPAMLACLADKDDKVRLAAVRACSKLGDAAPVAQLIAATRDEKPAVVTEAYVALARNASRVPPSVLLEGIPKLDMFALEYVVYGIAQAGGTLPLEALPHLGDACVGAEGQDESVTADRLMSWAAACTPDEVLLAALRRPDATLRSVATWVLEKKIERKQTTSPTIVEQLMALESVVEEPASGAAPGAQPRGAGADDADEDDDAYDEDEDFDEDEDDEAYGVQYELQPLPDVAAQLLAAFGASIPDSYLATLRQQAHRQARTMARFAALQWLAETHDPRCVPLLIAYVTEPEAGPLRADSVKLLCSYLAAPEVADAVKAQVAGCLEQALAGSDSAVVRALTDGLAAVGAWPHRPASLDQALWTLAERPAKEGTAGKASALRALMRLGAAPRADVLLEALGADSEDVAKAAVEWLGALPQDALAETVVEALVALVRRLEGQDGYGPLYGAPARAAKRAAAVLGHLGSRAPLPPLFVALSGVSWDLREAAARALSRIGEAVPLAPILAQLQDADKSKRKYAVLALAGRADPVAVDALVRAYESSDPELRQWVSLVLASIGAKRPELLPVPALLQEARNTESPSLTEYRIPQTQAQAVLALHKRGPDLPLAEILTLLTHGSGPVREACLLTLRALGEALPVERVVPYLGDHDSEVRSAALHALLAGGPAVPVTVFTTRLPQIDPESLPLLVDRLAREPAGPDTAAARTCLRTLLSRPPDATLARMLDALDRSAQAGLPASTLEGIGDLLTEHALAAEPQIRARGITLLRQHLPARFKALQAQATFALTEPGTPDPASLWADQSFHALLDRLTRLPRYAQTDWEQLQSAAQARLALVRQAALAAATHRTGKQPLPETILHLAWTLRTDPHPAVKNQANTTITEILTKEGALEDA